MALLLVAALWKVSIVVTASLPIAVCAIGITAFSCLPTMAGRRSVRYVELSVAAVVVAVAVPLLPLLKAVLGI